MKKWIILIIIGVILLLVGLSFWIFGGIKVNLVGDGEVNTSFNVPYQDGGFTVMKYDKELGRDKYSYEENNNIDINKLGKYEYNYKIKYFIFNYELKRIVNVVDDILPEITTNIDHVTKDYCTKKDINKLEYTANDNYDGDITDNVIIKESDDSIILSVTDSNGNMSSTTIPITYTEKPKDIFKLVGNSTIYVTNGSKYKEQGVTYKDGCGKKMLK